MNGRLLLTTATVAILAWNGAAYAQDGAATAAAADSAADTGDIVVTAQRREQSLQDTPVAVSAFNTAMLQARGVNDVINIAASTPGLYISQGTASPSTLQIAMRGALEQNGGTITSESPVAIYIDDVYQSRLSAANYDLADIERVEVLRGPQGTLYGRNSMTGAIKLITRQPDGRTWLNTDVSYARFQEVRIKASGGAPLSDAIAIAASAFYDKRAKGWQYNETTGQDVSKFSRYGAQLALGLTDIDGLEAVLTGRYIKSKTDGQHFLPINENFGITTNPFDPAVPFYHTRTPAAANGDNESYTVSLNLGYDIGDAKIRSITAYQHLKERWALDFAGGTYKFLNPLTFTTDLGTTAGTGFYRDSPGRQRQITQEFQLLGKALDDKLNYIFGLFYFNEKAFQSTAGDIYLGFPSVPSDIDTRSKSLAGYGQIDYEFVPSLTASVGLRYTHDKKSFLGHTPNAFGTLFTLDYGIKASVWTPKFNLQWKPSDHSMVYGTVSKGYRAAGFNSLNTGDPANYGVPYDPETAWSYEIGAKFDAFDRVLQMNIAAYYSTLTDLQTLAYGAVPGSFLFENAAKAEVKGVEIESTLRPSKWLNFFGNLTYTDNKYKSLAPNSQAAQAGATHLPLLSKWQYQIGGTVTVPVGEGAVDLSGDYNYRTSYYSLVTLAPASRNPAIGRANATVTYKAPGDQWEVYGQATNVFGSKDWFASAEFVPGVFGYKIPLEPTVWRIGFRYKM
jgi:iron complex outermembrane recepter protein